MFFLFFRLFIAGIISYNWIACTTGWRMHTFIVVCTTSKRRICNKYCNAINGTTTAAAAFTQRHRSATAIGDNSWRQRYRWRRKLLFLIGDTNNAPQSWQQQRMQFKGTRTTLSFIVFESIRSEIAVGKFTGTKKRRRRFAGKFRHNCSVKNSKHYVRTWWLRCQSQFSTRSAPMQLGICISKTR